VWGENADRLFPDVDAMVAWVDQPSLVPLLAHLPDDLKPAFRDYVVARMVEETRRLDGTCFETFRRINVAALAQLPLAGLSFGAGDHPRTQP
jgi:trans-aconitate methyltransferase